MNNIRYLRAFGILYSERQRGSALPNAPQPRAMEFVQERMSYPLSLKSFNDPPGGIGSLAFAAPQKMFGKPASEGQGRRVGLDQT